MSEKIVQLNEEVIKGQLCSSRIGLITGMFTASLCIYIVLLFCCTVNSLYSISAIFVLTSAKTGLFPCAQAIF